MFVDHKGNGTNGANIYAIVIDGKVEAIFRDVPYDAKKRTMERYSENHEQVILYKLNEETLVWVEQFKIVTNIIIK